MSYYANKEKREELALLSLKVFGTRSKYQYFVKERGYTIEAIESQMKLLETEIDRVTQENVNVNQGIENQDQGNIKSNRPRIKLSRTQRRIIQRHKAKQRDKAYRNKV